MTREEFIKLAKSWGYGYSDEDIADILSAWDDTKEALPGVTEREFTSELYGVSTEEEWLEYYAKNWLMHY